MSFNPNQLLNQSMAGLNPALLRAKQETAPAVPPPPFDPGMYADAYSRLGLLRIENVAELGCGAGNFISIMTKRGMRPEMYVGIDNSHRDISIAKAAYPGWKFIYGDFNDERIRAEYDRFGVYLMLNLLDTMEDDLAFLSLMPPEKPLLFSVPSSPQPDSCRFLASTNELRCYYSDVLRIQSIGRYKNKAGDTWSMVVGCRW